MGLHLIADITDIWLLNPANWWIVLQVAVGLGMVIFVHELGHFAVAKWCGVKCEKFYLGFDIGGLKICKFRWGETEYGIGILPLGGYVKMLGQEDNPGRAAEELERARLHPPAGQAAGRETSALFDPRSYMAKSVPQRMAIISAGVVMNAIFAFVIAAVAYGMGVPVEPCIAGNVLPGEAAWRAGLRPGDRIVQIGDVKDPMFRDLQSGVVLGDNLEQGVKFLVERPGVRGPLEFILVPDRSRLAPMIGLSAAHSTVLDKPPAIPTMPAGQLKDGFKPGDQIVEINGVSVSDEVELERELALNRGKISVTVLRRHDGGQSERLTIEVPASPVRTSGLALEMGPVTAIQADSPAERAGLRKGDRLLSVDGQPIEDPLRLPDQLIERAGQTIRLAWRRGDQVIEKTVDLSDMLIQPRPAFIEHPLTIPPLGLAYQVDNRVAAVEPGGPAASRGIRRGDWIEAAAIVPPGEEVLDKYDVGQERRDITLGAKKRGWAFLFHELQFAVPGTTVELTLKDGRTVTVSPRNEQQWLNPERGLRFQPVYVTKKAESLGEALALGARETGESLSQVYRFLRKIGSQISIKALGGPVRIAEVAGEEASAGLSRFFLFLCMLSANLAVINFLPIPLLDGGHMVFLALEGIRGKPVSERVVLAFHYVGFVFIVSLMLFVLLLDVGLISRTS